ncbi:MAG TPA: sodium/proton-translocating pyrophosphatase, partial [Longimicrobiales bacterium]
MIDLTQFAIPLGIIGLLAAFVVYLYVKKQPDGNDRMREIAALIQDGAMAFLRREYMTLALFVVVVAAALWFATSQQTALAYVSGALSSMIAGFFGMTAATRANVRTAAAAQSEGQAKALRTAFMGGAVMGLAVAALGLTGIGLWYFLYGASAISGTDFVTFSEIISGYAMGASSIALFARVGGGIYTKAADVGADLVGKVEAGIPEDDPRNPATIADNVGDNVGDVAGMGADLFGSYVATILATMVLGQEIRVNDAFGGLSPILLPMVICG